MQLKLSRWNLAKRFGRRARRAAKRAAACLAVSLATAWTTSASAVVVHLEVTPTEDLSQVFVIYNNYVPNSSPGAWLFALGDIPGGTTTVFDHELDSYWSNERFDDPRAGYMLFGLHGTGDNRGVSLSFPDDSLVTSGGSWDSFIQSTYGQDGWYPEDWVVSTWGENWAWTMSYSFPNETHVSFGATATMVNMSDAVNGGFAIATVPEPATWVLLASGAAVGVVAARRRTRQD